MNRTSTFISVPLTLLTIGLGPIFAGPFTLTGNSTGNSIDATYRSSTQVSAEQLSQVSEQLAHQSAVTTRNTYEQSTRPTGESVCGPGRPTPGSRALTSNQPGNGHRTPIGRSAALCRRTV